MAQAEFTHVPVMLEEAVEALRGGLWEFWLMNMVRGR